MVAKKSAKTVKLSYTERVLGAFTQVQREHRKHAIHIATLRAQVRKTAQERKDKLGPLWSNWVGKAIHKLEEEGIFAATEPAGTLTLTPLGKKAVNAARQSLSDSTNVIPSSVPEELIWKEIQAPTRGTKRGRRSSIKPLYVGESDGGDGDETFPSARATRSKRPRTSTKRGSPSKKPVAKMTKTELQAKLHALQKDYEDAVWRRDTSPLTDLDEDEFSETNRLKAELQQRKAEVEQLRRELAVAKGQAQLDEARAGTPYRFSTPETTDLAFSSLIRPASGVPTRSRPLLGVTRTQSGSFISNLSKQPTPAPSSPGAGLVDDQIFDGVASRHGNDDTGVFDMQEDTNGHGQPASPSSVTPEVEADSEKFLELKRALETRVAEVNQLQTQFSRLRREYSNLEAAFREQGSRLTSLLPQLEGESSDSERALRRAKAELEASHALQLEELHRDIEERDASIAASNAEKENYLARLSSLEQALADAESTIAKYVAQVMTADATIVTLRSEKSDAQKESEVELQAQTSIVQELEEQVQSLTMEATSLKEMIEQLEASKEAATASLQQAVLQQALLSEKLGEKEVENESLGEQLSDSMNEMSALKATLTTSETSVTTLMSRVSSLADSLSQSRATVEELSQSLSSARQETATLREQFMTTGLSVATLESELAVSKQTIDGLTMQLATAVNERADLTLELQSAQKAGEAKALSIEELKSVLATRTDDLKKAEEVAADLRESLKGTAAKLTAEVDRNRGYKENLSRKDAEVKDLTNKLSMAESMAGKLQSEAQMNETNVQNLRSQLAEAQDVATTTQDLLSLTETRHSRQLAEQKSVISDLQALLNSGRTELDGLKSELQDAHTTTGELQAQLKDQGTNLANARVSLDVERRRASNLESDLAAAIGRAQEVEEELVELRVSKEADEATIKNLKGMFTGLQETNMRTFAEVSSKVVTAKSSPAPKRRSTRTVAKPPPFKLT
ncbi:hypothetical protein Hypma_005764 [Hypsizygus marmoreus]|uniref:Uncharacterized protein n=1 Tax=Hypsizygus marmoreus TaxID=39966 RepID=A0A369KCP2_HYPMA|nr:hypothetical protein Hypma_005764 [Hypsizygus marmoreus]